MLEPLQRGASDAERAVVNVRALRRVERLSDRPDRHVTVRRDRAQLVWVEGAELHHSPGRARLPEVEEAPVHARVHEAEASGCASHGDPAPARRRGLRQTKEYEQQKNMSKQKK